MIKGIGHIGITVRNVEESLAAISKVLNIPTPQVQDYSERKLRVGLVEVNKVGLEFIQDYSEEGKFAQFVKERGDSIHHFCLLTNEIELDIERLQNRGIEMVDQTPRVGVRGKRIALIKPSALNGIPLELSEP